MNFDRRLSRISQHVSDAPDPRLATFQARLREVSNEDLAAIYDFLVELKDRVYPENPTEEEARAMESIAQLYTPLEE